MNLIFFGTSEFSLHVLDRLIELGIKPSHIVTVPDKPQGRKMLLTPPPAKVWAERHEVPFMQFQKLDDEAAAQLKELNPDFFLVASYGKIIPKKVLDIPARGALNIHPSLLPKYRGATPLQSAILADDEDIGVTLMLMDEQMDHGDILSAQKLTSKEWPPSFNEFEYETARTGADMAAGFLNHPEKYTSTQQNHEAATFTKKIEKEDGLVSLDELAGEKGWKAYLKYKALQGWPGIFFFTEKSVGAGDQETRTKIRVNVKNASWNKENSTLEIQRVVPEGKKEMSWKEFMNFLGK